MAQARSHERAVAFGFAYCLGCSDEGTGRVFAAEISLGAGVIVCAGVDETFL
jgi:hypothetical protein